ncbi:hypothetical protein LAZ67_13002368 [Cordylochernes scorpioides]|uniref:Mos1 transposase HTH domain-containing protein n=1 Tax=Cordylochernes scorpioides TaxID=51811 RepID=A0ABY6L9B7_9ARAC|nr:hypothetical protein LAZ67_13002368 [Cordylochernes scorpioides]
MDSTNNDSSMFSKDLTTPLFIEITPDDTVANSKQAKEDSKAYQNYIQDVLTQQRANFGRLLDVYRQEMNKKNQLLKELGELEAKCRDPNRGLPPGARCGDFTMEQKLKQRICIEFCVKLQISATETFEMLNKAFPNDAPKRTTVFEWHSRFKAGRISIEDDPRQGRPKFQRTDENVQKITDLIKENPRTTLLEQDTGISKTTIGRIVTEDLKLKKTPAKFIPRFLTNEQKLCRLATCEDMMEMTRTDPEWKDKIITGDETWVYGYDPETKPQTAEWRVGKLFYENHIRIMIQNSKFPPSCYVGNETRGTYWCELLLRCRLYLVKRSVTSSFHGPLQFREQEKVTGSQIWGIRGVIVVQKPIFVLPQIRAFLADCFAQIAHNLQCSGVRHALRRSHLLGLLRKFCTTDKRCFSPRYEVFWIIFDFYLLEKMDQRTCIKFCVKNEIMCTDAFRMLTVAYGEATLDRSNVYRWYKMFSEGRGDVNDEERAGRPSTSTTDEKNNEVEKMILANRRITVREVAEDLNISIGSCHSIFINDLVMRRVDRKIRTKIAQLRPKIASHEHC